MEYQDARQIIALYANDCLELFSDYWMRYPKGQNAQYIIDRLGEKQSFYENIDQSISDKINMVRCLLIKNMQ